MPLVGCTEATGNGGSGGSAGSGGNGGAAGSGGAAASDACTNQGDLAITCDREFVDTAQDCGIDAWFDCTPGEDDVVAQCMAATSSECIQDDTGMSEDCGDCFGATIACVEANCFSCGPNADGQECLACRDEKCNDSLYECAGDIVEGCDGEVWCQRVDCDDFVDCTEDVCNPVNGICSNIPLDDGAPCAGGVCQSAACALTDTVLPCTEQAIRNAIAMGGGPYTFDCDDPTVLVTKAEIIIDNNVILVGEGKLTVDGDRDHGVFSVSEGVTAELSGFGIARGNEEGIFNEGGTLRLTASTIWGNAGNGGTMIATSCIVAENEGTGISNGETMIVTNSTASRNGGGGVLNGGTATIFDSTVSGSFGTGIVNWGTLSIANASVVGSEHIGIVNEGTLWMWSCTVSENSGGGIHSSGIFDCGGTMVITNSTVSDNEGDALFACGSTTITNSTVSGSVVTDGQNSSVDIAATLIDGACSHWNESVSWTSSGHNIESPGDTCGFDQEGDQSGITEARLNLGPLANNGGPTMTHKPGDGGLDDGTSVAIDHIPGDACDLTKDQRGQPRPETDGTMCDVGSVEVQSGGQ
jgi:hypothetical protein